MSSPTNTAQRGRGPFAVLRRAKNIKNASEEERSALLEDAERIESWCAWLVLFAIVLEVVVWISPLCPFLFKAGNALSDGAVAIGILGEMRFGQVVGNILKIVLAEAVERAANAELETEKLRARFSWRRLSAKQSAAVSKVLASEPPHSLRITYPGNDPEANTFAREIGLAFSKNGWKVGFVAHSSSQEVVFGLRIPTTVYPLRPDVAILCNLVQKAISQAGIEYTYHPFAITGMSMGSGVATDWPCPIMYVGSKPMTEAE
jgi:hypothetical protein